MRVLFVLSRVPYPLEKGDKLRAFHLIRELSADHEINLFCLADEKTDPEAERQLKQYCSEIYIHRIPIFTKLFKLFLSIFSKKPFQVEYFYSRKAQRKFDDFVENHLPQHIFCQLIRTAEYAKKYSLIPKTIDYMDAFSIGMERMAKKAKWPLSFIMNEEFLRLKLFEQEVAPYFDHHLIISEQDKECISINESIEVLPNGIDPVFFKDVIIDKTRDVLFTGNMSYRPNVESAKYLVNEIMPLVWQKFPNTKVTLAGANPSPSVLALRSEIVEVTGWIDDISEVYHSAKVFVAPMLINSGLQNKLLEAMACEVPSVTTSLANNALGAKDEVHLLIGDDTESLAKRINTILSDDALGRKLSIAGKNFVLGNYSWRNEAGRLTQIMELTQN